MVLTPTGDEPVRGAAFGTLEPEFTPYPEGGAAPIVMGLQGGFMVVPTIRIQAEPDDPDELCVTLRLTNTLEEGGVPLPGLERVFTLERVDDAYDTPALENFLSFLRTDLIGHQLTMEVEVSAEDFVAHDTTTFELGPPEF